MDDEEYDISEEFLAELTRKYADIEHPLFMDELPSDISANPDLEALHKLLSDGETRDSIAQKYKEVGNGYVAEGRHYYEAAISSYTDGIAAGSKDAVLNSQLYSNRALVHLRLGENVTCVNDCRHSIKFDKFNYKSYYRGALASFNLSLYKQALLFCTECAKAIRSDPGVKVFESEKGDNFKLLSLVDDGFAEFYRKALKRYTEYELEKRRSADQQRRLEESEMAREAEVCSKLKLRGLELRENLFEIPESQTVVFYLLNDTLHTSCLFVYDEMELSDYIQDYDHSTSVLSHLRVMFGEQGRFSGKNAHPFYQVSQDEVLGFSLTEPLQSVVSRSRRVFKVSVVHIVVNKQALAGFTVL